LRSYARTWAAELKDRGIRVNTLSAGPTDTPMLNALGATPEATEAMKKMFASIVPLGRVGRPEEVAAGALYLASNESSYVTVLIWPTTAV
jgi:NAD(P)-dependent dehydrogenase (short-subunit alcohol dehydrogenase family)